jgi:fibro-slime domain-containing protein
MKSFHLIPFSLLALWVGCGGNSPEVVVGGGDKDASTGSSDGAGSTSTGTGVISLGDSQVVDPFAPLCDGACSEGAATVPPVCGDGKINQPDEKCDDGNTVSGDGCTGNCQQIEANFVCPTPGQPCVSTVKCGDGKISAGVETCDDGNTTPGDGCDAMCQVEKGWSCPVAGELCTPICGDGIIVGDEECEFYNGAKPMAGNGCDTTCHIEPGWDCSATMMTCTKTVCGNKIVERGEQCDDGNNVPFDGCFNCQAEPNCTAGVCMAVCGDGKRYGSEQCDDGNIRDGDGCSHDCKIEMGYMCTDITPAATDTINLPVIYRDFIGDIKNDETATRGSTALVNARTAAGVKLHPDFNHFFGSGTKGVLQSQIGADGLPVYVTPNNPGEPGNFTGQANFNKWYRDDPVYNRPVIDTLALTRNAQGLYGFDSGNFFGPLDNRGFVPTLDAHATCANHNFSFTTLTRFWFEYGGGETFDFSGDDDVWVFVGGYLVLDLGGLHSRLTGSFTLDATSGVAHMTSALGNADIDAKLKIGSVYEVAMFHAEREECQSNFKLTLKDFNKPKSQCGPICGDGIVVRGEVCDDGKNDGSYGGCMPGCKKRAPFCGDAIVQMPPEKCDDGVNLSEYGGCAPGCVLGPYCGDGIVQSKFEQCDDGVNAGAYGGCAPGCVLGPRCGDGIVQKDNGEQCDPPSAATGCNAACKQSMVN